MRVAKRSNQSGASARLVGLMCAVVASVLAVSSARSDGCEPAWSALVGPSGVGVIETVRALAVFDDGTGPALYAGGHFTTAGGVTVNRIARWDGSAWSALVSPGGVGVSDSVWALRVFDDGTGPALYAGGHFITAGGVSVNRIARWDGHTWSALTGPSGVGIDAVVLSLEVFDDGTGPALYVGGHFITAGGVTVNRFARWDGSVWSAIAGPTGVGVTDAVRAMTVFDDGTGPALFAAGSFVSAGGVTVNRIARWDGSTWSALVGPSGMGVTDSVLSLTLFDDGSGPALYVGGGFTTAGGVPVNRIARWDGSAWSALAGPGAVGVNNAVFALMEFDGGAGNALYAGGDFTTAGGMTVNRIARWDGSAWSALVSPSGVGMNNGVRAVTVFDDGSGPHAYASGFFITAGGVTVNHIAKWQGCPPPAECPPDVNDDGEVDILDFLDFIDSFGTCDGQPAPCAGTSGVSADYNGDTLVDILDLLDFLDAFGRGC